MKLILKYPSLIIWYLPIFFFVHGMCEYYNHISMIESVILLFCYLLIALLLHFTVSKILREGWRSAVFIQYPLFIFFYFSALHQFLISINDDSILTSYTLILPILIIIGIILFIYIKRKKNPPLKFINFFSILFAIAILTDLFALLYKYSPADDSSKGKKEKNTPPFIFKNKPPIYLLVFDEYASSQSLFSRFGFRNELDLKLKSQGFHIFNNSSSNYNFTSFSIASLLNMSYLNNFNHDKVTHKDYLWAESQIYRNKSIDILEKNDYEIHNLSIFDFKNYPSKRSFYLLANGTLLLRNRTFFRYIFKDLGWYLIRLNIPFINYWENRIYDVDKENNNLKILLNEKNTISKDKKDFFYAHFIMPHPPYFYDKFNKLRPRKEVLKEVKTASDPTIGYINNIQHTNSVISNLVFQIKRKEKNNVIIMVLGDHGYRKASANQADYFSNFNAIFLPTYLKMDQYPKQITLVNQMRLIFNLLTEENQPFLKDKMFYLKDAPKR